MSSHPTHTARWTLPSQHGIDSLRYEESAAIPNLKNDEVLVEMHAASINYRDLVITKVRPIQGSPIFVLYATQVFLTKPTERRKFPALPVSDSGL